MERCLAAAGALGQVLVLGGPFRPEPLRDPSLARARGGCSQPSPPIPKNRWKAHGKRAWRAWSRAPGIGRYLRGSRMGIMTASPKPPTLQQLSGSSGRQAAGAPSLPRVGRICGVCSVLHGTASEPERCGRCLWDFPGSASFEQYIGSPAGPGRSCLTLGWILVTRADFARITQTH